MAIDTETRRRSTVAVLPVADGTIGQADRQQVTWHYAGISAEAALVVPGLEWTLPENTMQFTLPKNTMQFTLPENTMQFTLPEGD